jgi:hypothetical protein
MMQTGHLDTDTLVRAIDDELNPSEHFAIDSHLASCEQCQIRFEELRVLSVRIDAWAASIPLVSTAADRDGLQSELDRREASARRHRKSGKLTRRAGWGIAVAAGVAVTLMLFPRLRHDAAILESPQASQAAGGTLEVEGETFVSLPYSNADLPMSTPRIVRMQVPVASLLDAGVVFEPVSNDAQALDRSVLADVLLGMDGEPLGVHVIGFE